MYWHKIDIMFYNHHARLSFFRFIPLFFHMYTWLYCWFINLWSISLNQSFYQIQIIMPGDIIKTFYQLTCSIQALYHHIIIISSNVHGLSLKSHLQTFWILWTSFQFCFAVFSEEHLYTWAALHFAARSTSIHFIMSGKKKIFAGIGKLNSFQYNLILADGWRVYNRNIFITKICKDSLTQYTPLVSSAILRRWWLYRWSGFHYAALSFLLFLILSFG